MTSSIREEAAALEHEQWAHWTKFMLQSLGLWGKSRDELLDLDLFEGSSPGACQRSALFNEEQVMNIMRWRRQCVTPYADLSEKEKDSDREWADKMFHILTGETIT